MDSKRGTEKDKNHGYEKGSRIVKQLTLRQERIARNLIGEQSKAFLLYEAEKAFELTMKLKRVFACSGQIFLERVPNCNIGPFFF